MIAIQRHATNVPDRDVASAAATRKDGPHVDNMPPGCDLGSADLPRVILSRLMQRKREWWDGACGVQHSRPRNRGSSKVDEAEVPEH